MEFTLLYNLFIGEEESNCFAVFYEEIITIHEYIQITKKFSEKHKYEIVWHQIKMLDTFTSYTN